jgi:hypothetical protein
MLSHLAMICYGIHAEALPILYKSRNLEFCGECFGSDYLNTKYQYYSIAFFISSLSQYAKPQSALESIGMTKNHIDTVARSQISVI